MHEEHLARRRALRLMLAAAGMVALLGPVMAQVVTATSFQLVWSASSSRTSPVALAGAGLSGNVYVFMAPTSGVTRTSFWLDNTAATGTPTHVEGSAPIDFVGTASDGTAKPWDTSAATPGTHTITTQVVTSAGTATFTTAFSVSSNTISPTAAPTARPIATPSAAPTGTLAPAPTPAGTPAPTAPSVAPTTAVSTTPTGFVTRSGTQLMLGGKPFVFTGFNIYQANSRSNCSYTMGTGTALDTALTDTGSGAEVFRAWFFQRLATTTGVRDWSAFDHTLSVARAHGVKVIVTLGNQWGSCESSTSYYKWDSWYTGGYKTQILPGTTVAYRQYVAEIVSRYENDPTIAMWQIMNEAEVKIDNTSTCAPAADLYNFAADMSGLIKSIDPNHLVSLGTMGGGQCGTQGSDYQKVHSVPAIDVCEFHDYHHETESMPSRLASDITACNADNKPIFVGESGIDPADVGGTLAARAGFFKAKLAAAMAAGVRGYLIWSWNNAGSELTSYKVGPADPTIGVIDAY